MPYLSAFQQLPLHIMEAIVKYYIPPFHTDPSESWLVLYKVSYLWRTLALPELCKEASIIASTAKGGDTFHISKPKGLGKDTALLRYVKEVRVNLQEDYMDQDDYDDFDDYRDAVESIPFNNFAATWPESLVFPNARSLRVDVTGFLKHCGMLGSTLGSGEFTWLAQRIRTSIPNLQNVTIVDTVYEVNSSHLSYFRNSWDADILMSPIFEKATRVSISVRALCPETFDPLVYNCSKLVQLDFTCEGNVELLHYIARESAATLEVLQIRNYPFQAIEGIIIDDEDQPVVFPRLRELSFCTCSSFNEFGIESDIDDDEDTVSIDESVSLFPVLRRLTWDRKYSFDGDELFRGNNDTLEYLDITLSTELINVLERHKVFSAGRYPRLNYVKIRESSDDNDDAFSDHYSDTSSEHPSGDLDSKLYLEHMARILSPKTQLLSIPYLGSYQYISAIVPETSNLWNIQVLSVGSIGEIFIDMLELIKHLPNLTRLKFTNNYIYPTLKDDIGDINEFVGAAYKTYYPLNPRFRFWIYEQGGYQAKRILALASTVLAIVCPNYAYTRVSRLARDPYQRELKGVSTKISNDQYSEILECLYRRSVEYLN